MDCFIFNFILFHVHTQAVKETILCHYYINDTFVFQLFSGNFDKLIEIILFKK